MTKLEAQNLFDTTCKEVLKTAPLPHWSILKNLKYTDAVVLELGIDKNIKRDFKWGKNLTSYAEAQEMVDKYYTGSYYTTNKGHFIYFDNANKPVSRLLLNDELNLMPGAVKFNISRNNHSQLKGTLNTAPGREGEHWIYGFSYRMFIDHREVKPGGWKPKQLDYTEIQNNVRFVHFADLFNKIESGEAGISPDTPIIITYSDDIVSLQTIAIDMAQYLNQYGAIASVLLAVALPGIGVAVSSSTIAGILSGITVLTNKIAKGEKVDATDIVKASNNLIPETAKPYIQKGLNVINSVANPTPQNLYNASKELGVKKEQVEKIVGSAIGKGSASLVVTSLETGKFDEVMKTISVIKSTYTTQQAVNTTDTQQFTSQLGKDGGIYKNALTQNIATLGLSGITATIPNIDVIAGGVLASSWKTLKNVEKRAWLNMATFRPDLSTKVPDMAIEVMKVQAQDSALLGLPYVIPAEVPENLKNCIALKITADTGVPVVSKAIENKTVTPTPVVTTPEVKKPKKKKSKRLAFR